MKCKASVNSSDFHAMCKREAIKDGFCTQHHPDNVAERARVRAEKEIEERRLFWLRAYGPSFADTLQQIADGAPDPIKLARGILAESKK